MANTRVKICGMTRPEDAAKAAELGADAIGLNFVGGPRKISYFRAAEILPLIPPLVEPVGLFEAGQLHDLRTNEELAEIEWSIETKQWYGDAKGLEAWRWGPAGAPWWIVVHISSRDTFGLLKDEVAAHKFRPQAVLLDVASGDMLGGTGQTFNWHWIAEARAAGELAGLPPIILAGGLNPDNVADAIRIAQPYAVDVSSGVEVAGKPGVKDAIKMRDFIQAVRGAG